MLSLDQCELIDKSLFYENCIKVNNLPFILFGYASLITVPNFKYANRQTGCVKHVATRLYQGSLSLGTKVWPGRVATLVPYPGNICFGDAFYIYDLLDKDVCWKYLLVRENNYSLIALDFYPLSEDKTKILETKERVVAFVALPDNDQYLGECDLEMQAYQIWKASNRWPNTLYLRNLISFYEKIPTHLKNDNYGDLLTDIIEKLSKNELVLSHLKLSQLPILMKIDKT